MGEPPSHDERKARGLPDPYLRVPVRDRTPHSDYLPGGAMEPGKQRNQFAHLAEHQDSLRSRHLRLLSREEASGLYPEEQVERYFRPPDAEPADSLDAVFGRAMETYRQRHGVVNRPTNNIGWNRKPYQGTPAVPPPVIEEHLP